MSKDLSQYTRICVYCSAPEYFSTLTKIVRKLAPQAHLTIIRPAGAIWNGEGGFPADAVIDEVFSVRALARPAQLVAHVRSLRSERFDCLVTQYESLRLRIFIALIHPGKAEMWMPMFGERDVPTGLIASLWDLTRLRARGYGNILRALIHATLLPVSSRVRIPKDR